jgi:hypothetical protein
MQAMRRYLSRPAAAAGLGLCCVLAGADAATYYVALTGNDAAAGSAVAPWRTVQKAANTMVAGDTAIIQPGDYGEYVATKAAGTAQAPITFRGLPGATLRAFRFYNHPHVTVSGLRFAGAQNLWNAHVRIEAGVHHATVTNCFFGPGVFAIAEDFVFNAASNSVRSPTVNFVAAGFADGGRVFFGGCGLEEYWYDNHDRAHTISRVTPNELFLSTPLLAETKNPAWAPIYAGANSAGMEGINFIISGGKSASNCTFAGNTFSNLFGCPITLQGEGHEVAHNTFTRLNSYYGLRANGSNHRIHGNLWYDCGNFLNYSPEELGIIPHPPGASWYDYQVGFIHAPGGGTNVQFCNNWLENIFNPLGQINELPGSFGFVVRSNVFVGIGANLSGGRNGLVFEDNTFFRCGYDWPSGAALTVGGNTSNTPASGIFIRRNAFIDVGSRRNVDLEGFYTLVNAVSSGAERNFVTSSETLGWSGRRYYTEPTGINGGDPVLQDADRPRGPDGIPFTQDDGLRPLPNSPIARGGVGALPPVPVTVGVPVAHFRVSAISSGFQWYDKTGGDFDPGWMARAPFRRNGKIRPYETPEALGVAPVTVQFSASNSIGAATAASTNWQGISIFRWTFGDGSVEFTTQPLVEHTFQSAGSFTVTLTVTGPTGATDVMSKTFRVLGDALPPPTVTGRSGQVLEWGISIAGAADVLPTLSNCVQVGGNSLWSLARRADGTLVAWGSNQAGQLNVPPGRWADAFAGWRHGIACATNGTVVEWGTPYGTALQTWEAARPAITNAVKVVAGDDHSAALLADGRVVTWGGRDSITAQPALSGIVDIAAGWYHMVALKGDGSVITWGEGADGQDNTVPASATDVVRVFAGPFTTFALRRDGTAVGWGLNNYGQCTVPAGLRDIVAIGAGRYHTLAITLTGTVHVWGDGGQGQLLVPADAVSAIATGPAFYQAQVIRARASALPAAPDRLRVLGP